jgi:prolyl oligopeptidase PreP (S9A serine peptidase family)
MFYKVWTQLLEFFQGGFGKKISPWFSDTFASFIIHFGGVVAIPNIQGGGRVDSDWHFSGRLVIQLYYLQRNILPT